MPVTKVQILKGQLINLKYSILESLISKKGKILDIAKSQFYKQFGTRYSDETAKSNAALSVIGLAAGEIPIVGSIIKAGLGFFSKDPAVVEAAKNVAGVCAFLKPNTAGNLPTQSTKKMHIKVDSLGIDKNITVDNLTPRVYAMYTLWVNLQTLQNQVDLCKKVYEDNIEYLSKGCETEALITHYINLDAFENKDIDSDYSVWKSGKMANYGKNYFSKKIWGSSQSNVQDVEAVDAQLASFKEWSDNIIKQVETSNSVSNRDLALNDKSSLVSEDFKASMQRIEDYISGKTPIPGENTSEPEPRKLNFGSVNDNKSFF